MKTVQLIERAHARPGAKGNMCNIGPIASKPEYYRALVEKVTSERVRQHFGGVCPGKVERFELPNLGALNFLLCEALDDGGTISLRADPQGKTFSTAFLRIAIELDEATAR